jgi:hypothetical protein
VSVLWTAPARMRHRDPLIDKMSVGVDVEHATRTPGRAYWAMRRAGISAEEARGHVVMLLSISDVKVVTRPDAFLMVDS